MAFIETSLLFAEAVRQAYMSGEEDYNMKPFVLADCKGKPVGLIEDGDSVIFCCKRGEREVQLTDCFVLTDFSYFPRKEFRNLRFVVFTLYHHKYIPLGVPVAFKPKPMKNTLAEVISSYNLKQLHVAESEKFAHVTFFFNGGSNVTFSGETDLVIPSPKDVPFELVPQLSLPKVASVLTEALQQKEFDLIVANFANGDVIGHTSNFEAKVLCAREVDKHLQQVVETALQNGYTVVVTADHGILETGLKPNGKPNVSHTNEPVPFVIVNSLLKGLKLKRGRLANVAPTILQLMGLQIPNEFEDTLLSEKLLRTVDRILLLILDGWGIGKKDATNPIHVANTRYFNYLAENFSFTLLSASGEDVGLLPGKPGNSEAGHMNIGAGRIVLQDDVIIQRSMNDGTFFENPVLIEAVEMVNSTNGKLHIIGLLSEKSSHGTLEYIIRTLELAKFGNLNNALVHLILDGRSTEPGSAPEMIINLGKTLKQIGIGTICTVVGRGIALDRSGDYLGKTKVAYDALVYGIGRHVRLDLARCTVP
ncbi:MAG: alkaline phosphatase family protein [Pseudothermotoga sp.]